MGSFLMKASGEAAPRFLPPFLSSLRFFLACTCCEDALGLVLTKVRPHVVVGDVLIVESNEFKQQNPAQS